MRPSEFTNISNLFKKVANKYDFMNDVMSFGIHRLWKSHFVDNLNIVNTSRVLDLACGTGDISIKLLKKYKLQQLFVADLQPAMLEKCTENLVNAGYLNFSSFALDAVQLPFADSSFDCVTISFGFRNFTNLTKSLQEIYRVLSPNGRLEILEFSKPAASIQPFYDLFLQQIPKIAQLAVKDEQSYKYLVDSIKAHPNQNQLQNIILESGFEKVYYTNHSLGIAATHTAIKSC